MSAQKRISISKPCREHFETFTTTPLGGFCNACQKEVVDFTNMSKEEILLFFSAPKSNTCGRFTQKQLEDMPVVQGPPQHTLFSLKGLGILSVTALSLAPSIEAIAQQQTEAPQVQVQTTTEKQQSTPSNQTESDSLVSGTITSKYGPVPLVDVFLKGSTVGTTADFDGNFTFPVPLEKGDTLVFSLLGFKNLEYVIRESSKINPIMIEAEMIEIETILMGEVAVHEPYVSRQSFWQKLTNLFR
jgi:hypothetical protein